MNIEPEKLRAVFIDELGIEADLVVDTLEYNTLAEWDSIAHMRLIVAIEDKFDIMIDTDDVIEMSTFKIAVDIVNKYVNED